MKVNERLRDASIARQVALVQYANGLVRNGIAQINQADRKLFAELLAELDAAVAGRLRPASLERALKNVRLVNAGALDSFLETVRSGLGELFSDELAFQSDLFERAAKVPVVRLNPDRLLDTALSKPFQGRLLDDWAGKLGADRLDRIERAVKIGYLEGRPIKQIVRELRGNPKQNYADGLLEIDRRSAEAVVRTAVSHIAGDARDRFFSANKDMVQAVQWLATLDTRTSSTCRVRDGLRYTCGDHKPIDHALPWLGGPGKAHWNCRSTAMPVLKSWKELGLDAEEFTPSQRASMDGQVPAGTTYSTWFAKQSAARQDEIVGATRGKLFRQGGLALDAFYNDRGRYLTIAQLRRANERAFEDAGL